MAKATANCTCAECGATFTKTTTKSNRREADAWESWAESNFTQCPQCWGKEQRKKEQETPLTFNVAIDPYNTKAPIILIFSGNTVPYKDNIKSLNYFWDDKPATGMMGFFDISKPQKCWSKRITLDNLEAELQKVEDLGAKIINNIKEIDLIAYAKYKQSADKKQAEQTEKEKIQADKIAQIEKPVCPDILKGAKWNNTVYGKKGNYSYYNNGNKVSLTNEEAEQVKKYVAAKIEYNNKVKEITGK